jgi:primosomal protein N' (replication factor Y)
MSLKVVRPGVGRLAEELRALFHCEVDEITAATGNEPLSAQLVIGTEAVLHRVRRSALVAVLELDQYLLAPQMRAEEATLEMLVRSARLVGGRGEDRGTLLVQTRQPDHEVVRGLVTGNPSEIMTTLTERRRRLNQPPFAAYARLRGSDASTYGEEVAAASAVTFVDLGEEKGLLIGENHEALCDALRRTPRDRRNVNIAVDPEDL